MKKILILLVWLLGLAAIAWLCGRGGAPAAGPAGALVAPAPSTPAPPVAAAPAPAPAVVPAAAAPAPSASVVAASLKIDEVLKRKIVEFRSGSASLTALGRATLAEIAPVLKDNPKLRFEVQGHTDAQGTEAANQALSQARAAAVKDMLTSLGVAADRIGAKGFGSSVPVADNNTAEGRARNRRIAFNVEENK